MKRSYIYLLAALLLPLQATFAHKADYIEDTLVFETLEAGEVEPEYFLDLGRRPGENENRTGFQRHTFALEYGITDNWMVDGRVSFDRDSGSSLRFEDAHFESRYRFFEEGTLPIDIAISAELFWERSEEDGSDIFGVAPRLILSKDFDPFNFTFNITEEIPLRSSDPSLNLAVGLRYDFPKFVRVGAEIKYAVDTREGSVIPQIGFVFPHDITVKFGYSRGFARNEESFFRGVFEVEF